MAKKDQQCFGSLSESDQQRAREEDEVKMLYMLDGQLRCQDCGAKVGAMKSPMSNGEGFYVPSPRPHEMPKPRREPPRKRGPRK
jgi:hypothetical protein